MSWGLKRGVKETGPASKGVKETEPASKGGGGERGNNG